MYRFLTISALRWWSGCACRSFGLVAAFAVWTTQPLAGQEMDSQQLLREARSAAGARLTGSGETADGHVVPARYEDSAMDELRPAKAPHDATVKATAKPLPPRPAAQRSRDGGSATADQPFKFSSPSAATLAGSTCVVLSLFFVAAWLMKRTAPKSMQALPTAAVEILGRAPLVRGQHLQLVRCGRRLLLLSVSATASQTLVEIGDPQEAELLLAACGGPGSRFAPQVENPRVQRDRQADGTDRVSQLLSSVAEDLRSAALSGGGRHA